MPIRQIAQALVLVGVFSVLGGWMWFTFMPFLQYLGTLPRWFFLLCIVLAIPSGSAIAFISGSFAFYGIADICDDIRGERMRWWEALFVPLRIVCYGTLAYGAVLGAVIIDIPEQMGLFPMAGALAAAAVIVAAIGWFWMTSEKDEAAPRPPVQPNKADVVHLR